MLILEANRGIVVCGCVPHASTSNLHSLILHLSNGDLHHNLVPWDVHQRLTLLLDFIGNGLTQLIEIVILPIFYPLLIYLSFEFVVEHILGD